MEQTSLPLKKRILHHGRQSFSILLCQLTPKVPVSLVGLQIHVEGLKGDSRFHAQVFPYSKAPAVYIPEVAVFCAGISLVKLLQKHPLHMVMIAAQVDSQLPSLPRLPLMKGGQIFNGHNHIRPGTEIPANAARIPVGQPNPP